MINSILLQAQSGGSGLSGMLMIVAMIAIFYFMMIRPQSKKQKELKRQREAMQKGDRVVTAGGIHGKIKDVKDAWFVIEVAPNIALKVDKGSVYPFAEEAASNTSNTSKEKKEKIKLEKESDKEEEENLPE